MPLIPRQAKPAPRVAINCKVPEAVAALLKHYSEFLESSQEHVVTETLRLAFRRDKEFQAWLATAHPEARLTERLGGEGITEPPRTSESSPSTEPPRVAESPRATESINSEAPKSRGRS